MKDSPFKILAVIAIILCFSIGSYRAGAENGYNDGFREGAEIAEEYALDSLFELNYDVKDNFGISAYDAAKVINKYDNKGEHLFDKYSDLVNASFALQYFINHFESELSNISEVALELGEIPSN